MKKCIGKRNVCVTVNSLYMRYLYVMLQSLYENCENGSIRLFVLQRDFTDKDKKMISDLTEEFNNEIVYIFCDPAEYADLPDSFRYNTNLSMEIMFRLRIPDYIPESVDKVLMLDVDLAILKDIKEIYDIELGDALFASSLNMFANGEVLPHYREYYRNRSNWKHYNVGVLLWNLDKIRSIYPKGYIFSKAIEHNDIFKPEFEEELINVEFGNDEIKEIPCEWNYMVDILKTYRKRPENPFYNIYNSDELKNKCGIIHYAAQNPWAAGYKSIGYDIWWDYCKKTPFYQEILEESYIKSEQQIEKNAQLNYYEENITTQIVKKRIISNLERLQIKNIAIYGAGQISKDLIEKVLNVSTISVEYLIDNNFYNRYFFPKRLDKKVIKENEWNSSDRIDAILVADPDYTVKAKTFSEKVNTKLVNLDYLLNKVKLVDKISEYLPESYNGKISIYGAGEIGKSVYIKILDKFSINYWVDQNYKKFEGNIQSPDALKGITDYIIVAIENENIYLEIKKNLLELSIPEKRIIWFPKMGKYE